MLAGSSTMPIQSALEFRRLSIPRAPMRRMSAVREEDEDDIYSSGYSAIYVPLSSLLESTAAAVMGHRSQRQSLPVMGDTERLLQRSASSPDEDVRTLPRPGSIETKPAQEWPCRPCGIFLGTCHLMIGCCLVVFDVATNSVTETAFAITASICFIVSGILSLIASRRLDRGTILLFFIFSLTSAAMCLAMFIESAIIVNQSCYHRLKACQEHKTNVHAALICFSLIEGTISLISMIVCFRSLRRAYSIEDPGSPFSVLMVGDLEKLQSPPPRTLRVSKNTKYNRMTLQYMLQD
uniref:Uncharacterized protein n=1 Tax=Plectus sambesii TaxID=2011161 RepID=A0A914V286_9BILA